VGYAVDVEIAIPPLIVSVNYNVDMVSREPSMTWCCIFRAGIARSVK